MSIVKDFREFAVKGNFIDLAVGVIIGAASGKVVTSIVEKLVMPPLGLLTGKVNLNDKKIVLMDGYTDGTTVIKEVAIGYGAVIQSLFELFVVAFVVFLVVRAYNKFRKAAPPDPTAQEKLLAEIRDLLKAQAPAKDAKTT